MKRMLRCRRAFLFVHLAFFIFGCGRNQQNSNATLHNVQTDENFEESFEYLVRWVTNHNTECTLDFRGGFPPQPSTPACGEFWADFNKFSRSFSDYCTDLTRDEVMREPDGNLGRQIFFTRCFDRYKSIVETAAAKISRADGPAALDRFMEALTASEPNADGVTRPASLFQLTYLRPFISQDFVKNLLETLAFPTGSVVYDGETSRLIFSDKHLEADVNYLNVALRYAASEVQTIFAGLSDERKLFWTTDSNGIGGDSRVEPFDVLVVSLKNSLIYSVKFLGINQLNTIEMGKVVTTGLKRLFGVSIEEGKDEFYLFRDQSRPAVLKGIAVCASHKPLSMLKSMVQYKIFGQGNLSFLGAGQSVVQMIDMREMEGRELQSGAQLQCGDKNYDYSINSIGGGVVIAKPNIKPKAKIKAVITTALVKEMDVQTLAGALVYLQSKGYWLQPSWSNGYIPGLWESVDDLKSDFLNEVNKADIYIPVSHNSSLDEVVLGTKQALKIRLNKNFTRADGSTAELELVFYTPPTEKNLHNKMIQLTDKELKQVFTERRMRGASSMFVLSTSCFSETTVDTWMRAFRMFAAADQNAVGGVHDAPIVVGSKRGFATSSPIQILSHFEYPFSVLDGFGEGHSTEDLVSLLAKPLNPTYQREILTWAERLYRLSGLQEETRWESIWDSAWKRVDPGFANNFEAVTNLENPSYWDGTARIDIIFTNSKNAAERYIF